MLAGVILFPAHTHAKCTFWLGFAHFAGLPHHPAKCALHLPPRLRGGWRASARRVGLCFSDARRREDCATPTCPRGSPAPPAWPGIWRKASPARMRPFWRDKGSAHGKSGRCTLVHVRSRIGFRAPILASSSRCQSAVGTARSIVLDRNISGTCQGLFVFSRRAFLCRFSKPRLKCWR